jgi:hypothetical protein
MSSEEKAAESDGKSSPIARALKRKLGNWWFPVVLATLPVSMQSIFWVYFLLLATRPVNTLIVIVISIGAFVLSAQLTFSSASLASKRDDDAMYNWYVAFLVANAFLLITVEFATLYWVIGTRPNFNPELSRWDAIYFALGTLTTADTGTIAPISDLARALVSGQMVVDLLFVAGALTIAVARWSKGSS